MSTKCQLADDFTFLACVQENLGFMAAIERCMAQANSQCGASFGARPKSAPQPDAGALSFGLVYS